MKTTLVTSATGEPVTFKDMKLQGRLVSTGTDEQALVNGYIAAARKQCEYITGRIFNYSIFKSYHQEWPSSGEIVLPNAPLKSIPSTGVVYKQSTGNSTTFDSTSWEADIVSKPGRLALRNNEDWPTETLWNNNPISIEMRCGYTSGGSANDSTKVPENVRLAIKLLAGHYYENRENTSIIIGGSVDTIPDGVVSLLTNDKDWAF